MILQSRKTSRVVTVNITDQVTSVYEFSTMEGAPTLNVTVNDPEWLVTNLDILDVDVDGRLDHVETKYGNEWYRLVKVSPSDDDLTLQFEHRTTAILRRYKKPKLHRRVPGYTRAMFIKSLVNDARADGHNIELVAPRLSQRQAIAKGQTPKQPVDPAGVKGIPKKANLTVKGAKATKQQRANAAVALGVADQLLASSGSGIRWRVNMALMEALITESRLTNLQGGDRDSAGILQVRRSVHSGVNPRNVEQVVGLFLTKGFTGRGGAITLAATTTMRPHEIAQACQGSAFSDGSNYKEWQSEAEAWIKAYHVIKNPEDMTQDVEVDGAYYFGRGYDSSGGVIPADDSWTAMNRLANEVNWRIFVRGNNVYFLSDDDLYKQKPELELSRNSPRITHVSFDWDEGKPVNELSLTIERKDIRHGTNIEMADAGAASGRWLVWDVERDSANGFSNLICRSPQQTKKEPAPQRESVTVGDAPGARKSDAFQTLLRNMKAVDRNTPSYLYGGGHGPSLDSLGPSTRFDCSSSCSWVLHKSGLFAPDQAWVSGDFAAKYGKPGRGRLFTVWANGNHVWIQLHAGPYKRFDTGGPRTIYNVRGETVGTIRSGAHLSTQARSTAGFTPRHYEGM